MDSNWQLGGVNINDSSLRLVSPANSSAVCQANILESSSSSAATVVDSLCPTMWDQVSASQNLGFSNVHHNESTSNVLGNGLGGMVSLRDGFDNISGLAWGSPNDIIKSGTFLPGAVGFLSQSLPHFPADSGFIERAARYSCFSGGNFGEILNPFSATETLNLEPRGLAPMQRSQEAFGGQTGPPMFEAIVQKNGMHMAEISKCACISADPGVSDGCLLKNEKNNDCFGRSKSNNEAQMGVSDPNGDSEEAEYSGQGDPTELEGAVGASNRGVGLKKRKRSCQDSELDQGMGFSEHQAEAAKKKGKQNSSPTYNKSGGKDGKQEPKASDSPKEEYIHVRARRGQATNSHSLAERVRREKISERMKFLQDLVPGCSKVTGKAVMLDEIINYVQSLQRQVEFLSMKLATVNPQLDCNLERLLSEDILQLRAGPSSSLPCPPDMPMGPPFLQSQGIPQTSIQLLGNPMDALQRSMDLSLTATRGGYREPSSHQVSTNWGDELHNALQMGLITTAPLSSHDMSGSLPAGQTKADI